MNSKTQKSSVIPSKVMVFSLNEKTSSYALTKTVRSVIEAIPMGEGSLQFTIIGPDSKTVAISFSIKSKTVRSQFFQLVKPDFIENSLLSGRRIELIVYSEKSAA